jgi:predicted nuclease with TOPRIM domain
MNKLNYILKDFSSLERVPDEFIKLVEKAVAENQELKNLLTERDNDIQKLKEQLNEVQIEDSQLIEQRLIQRMTKLKSDFRTMYETQSNFILQKIDLLKQEQRDNIASLYKH